MQVALLLLVGVEAVDQHADHGEHERWCSQAVGRVAAVAESCDYRREEVDDGAADVGESQECHHEPHLGVANSHDKTLPGSLFVGVVLLAEVFFEVPLNEFAFEGR